MIIVGLLSNKTEAEEVRFIAQVCKIEERIHFIARKEAIRRFINQVDDVKSDTNN